LFFMGGQNMPHNMIPEQRRHTDLRDREIATLCHDLRQCVTAGLLLAQMPNDDLLDGETRRRFSLIKQTLHHAANLLETASGEPPARDQVVNLSDLVQECTTVAEFGHKVRFVSEVDDAPLVTGDPLLLHRAVDNMIDNAGRAAGQGGDVVVRVGTDAAGVWVEVVDDGPGFGEIEHGTGQGLSVVSSAARACGGRLEIASGPGPGTTVRMAFPRQTAEVRTAPSLRRTP
jgi:signal transduction histidine kinase